MLAAWELGAPAVAGQCEARTMYSCMSRARRISQSAAAPLPPDSSAQTVLFIAETEMFIAETEIFIAQTETLINSQTVLFSAVSIE